MTSINDRYLVASRSFIDFAGALSEGDWTTPVSCTPGWTVRDVLSHVSGVPDDALAGRLDGVATEPWTASQVARNAEFSVTELLTRWEEQREAFAGAIDAMGEGRPPFDCHAHEHDVRHALGRPGNRESIVVVEGADALLGNLADVPVSLTVRFDDGRHVETGSGGPSVTLATTRFEIFRSMLGRRTPAQVRSLDWSGDRGAVDLLVADWFGFGPSEVDIVE